MCVREKPCLSIAIWFQAISTVTFFYGSIPFLIEESESKNVSVAAAGLIASCYNYPSLLLGMCIGPISVRFGRKRLLIFGLIASCVGTLVFGFCEYFSSPALFISVGLVSRILAGLGGFFHKTMVYALPTKYLFSHL